MKELSVNSNYKNIETNKIYHTLLISNSENNEYSQVVYLDENGDLWSIDTKIFLNKMDFLNKESISLNINPASDKYPHIGSFYYNIKENSSNAACSVLYATNTKSELPVTIFFLCDGKIEYLEFEDFKKHFKK